LISYGLLAGYIYGYRTEKTGQRSIVLSQELPVARFNCPFEDSQWLRGTCVNVRKRNQAGALKIRYEESVFESLRANGEINGIKFTRNCLCSHVPCAFDSIERGYMDLRMCLSKTDKERRNADRETQPRLR